MQTRARIWIARRTVGVVLTALLGFVGPAAAQAPAAQGTGAPQAPAVAAPEAQAPGPDETPQGEPYIYKPDGRRDPFVSLLSRGADPSPQVTKATSGLRGLSTADISVRGIVQSRGALIAMVQAPDGKTYLAHANDRLVDGVITQVTTQGVVVLQEVNDPLSLVKQREVRKSLRSVEQGK
jgi:Tfp pilus assembly protein PilP